MQVQQEVSANRLQAKVGRILEVLVDEVTETGATGRSSADAPEIDGLVYIDSARTSDLRAGELVKVKVTSADEYDLFASPLCP